MQFIDKYKISEELVNFFDEKITISLAKKLKEDNFKKPLDSLTNLLLLRDHSIKRPEFSSDYILLLDQGLIDEN
tara:strand:+ start:975 stop:1196 length:222 start_codon:yes stop_codon:yes gene_type:complete